MTGGSSGGPWVYGWKGQSPPNPLPGGGYVNGHNDYKYTSSQPRDVLPVLRHGRRPGSLRRGYRCRDDRLLIPRESVDGGSARLRSPAIPALNAGSQQRLSAAAFSRAGR